MFIRLESKTPLRTYGNYLIFKEREEIVLVNKGKYEITLKITLSNKGNK